MTITGVTSANGSIKSTENSIFTLNPPYRGIKTVDISKIDAYTRQTFKSLIQEREQMELPYFIALVDSPKETKIVDATQFFREHFDRSRVYKPIIPNAKIYRIDKLADKVFDNFATLIEIFEDNGRLAKFMYACDPALDPQVRGEERNYLGSFFEELSQNVVNNKKEVIKLTLEKAFFWYRKSVEDGFFGGHMALACWYETGNAIVEPSLELSFEHARKARDTLPVNHPDYLRYKDGIQKEALRILTKLIEHKKNKAAG